MKYLSTLMRFGLTEKEAKLYLDVLEAGISRVSDIAKRLDWHRAEIYRLLPWLVTRGILLPFSRGKSPLYSATNPENLEKLLQELHGEFSAILPDLKEKFFAKKVENTVQLYEGREAIGHLYEDIARSMPKWGTYYRYSSRKSDELMWEKPYGNYRKIRKEKEIRRLVIMSESGSKRKNNDPNRTVASIPARFDPFDDNCQKIIYWNKVAIVDLNSHMGFSIENPDLARFEIKLFKFMYKFLKEYER